MRKIMCYCGRTQLDPHNCDWVVEGRPLCDPDCLKRSRPIQAARHVPIGTCWAFPHRTLAEVGVTRIIIREDGSYAVA